MGFDPDDAQRYVDGVDYPASKETMLSTWENGAPDELVELIAGVPLGEFSGPEEFMNHIRAVPNRDNLAGLEERFATHVHRGKGTTHEGRNQAIDERERRKPRVHGFQRRCLSRYQGQRGRGPVPQVREVCRYTGEKREYYFGGSGQAGISVGAA